MTAQRRRQKRQTRFASSPPSPSPFSFPFLSSHFLLSFHCCCSTSQPVSQPASQPFSLCLSLFLSAISSSSSGAAISHPKFTTYCIPSRISIIATSFWPATVLTWLLRLVFPPTATTIEPWLFFHSFIHSFFLSFFLSQCCCCWWVGVVHLSGLTSISSYRVWSDECPVLLLLRSCRVFFSFLKPFFGGGVAVSCCIWLVGWLVGTTLFFARWHLLVRSFLFHK